MTKASTKGGFFGKALAAACSFALAASLVPAAALTAMAAPVNVQVNVGTLAENGNYKVFKTVTVDLSDISASSKAYAARVFYSAASSAWGVAATKDFITVETLAKKAGVDQYWNSDASINYNTVAWVSNSSTNAVAKLKTDDFKSYDEANSLNYYPETTKSDPDTSVVDKVPAGIAANAKWAVMDGSLDAEELASAILNGTKTSTDISHATQFLGLTEDSYKNAVARLDKITNDSALQSVNILVDAPENATRIAGKNWDDTMADAVDATFGANSKGQITDFVLATVDNFADALAASSLAGAYECPIIMTSGSSLTEKAGKLLEKYTADPENNRVTIYVVGGKAAISDAVVNSIWGLKKFYGAQAGSTGSGLAIERIAGKESWDTSLEIYKHLVDKKNDYTKSGEGDLIIATSQGFQDAMSIAPYAYNTATPIVLTNNQNVLADSALKAFFGENSNCKLNPTSSVINIIGGKAVVAGSVEGQLVSIDSDNVNRTAGKTAYNTSNLISTLLYNESGAGRFAKAGTAFQDGTVACFATGIKYEDALASAAYCGTANVGGRAKCATLSLVEDGDETTVTNFLGTFAKGNGGAVTDAIIFGGAGIVPESILMNIDATL